MEFAFTLWDSRCKKVFLDVFTGESKIEALTECRTFYNSENIIVLAISQIPR